MKKLVYIFIAIFVWLGFASTILADQESKSGLVINVSIIKAGTHLLAKLIEEITGATMAYAPAVTVLNQNLINVLQPQNFYVTHAPCSENNYKVALNNNAKIILLLRDPRDVLISYVHWLKGEHAYRLTLPTGLTFGNGVEPGWEYATLPLDQMINQFIKQYPIKAPQIHEYTTIAEFYHLYLPWQNYPTVLTTSFEKLVGRQGGADAVTQEDEIMKIAQFLNKPIDRNQAKMISSRLFGGRGPKSCPHCTTFREGHIGAWRRALNRRQIQALKSIKGFNELLVALNYEKDNNW